MKPESLKELIRLEFNELLDSQFGEVEYLDEVKDFAQKILEDRFREFIEKNNQV